MDRSAASAIFGREGHLSSVYVRLARGEAFTAFKDALERDKRLGLQAFREEQYFQAQTEGRATFIAAMGTFIAILFAGGAMLGAMITMFAAIENRQKEVGTLRALGFPRRVVLLGFLLESSAIALAAGAAGVGVACALVFSKITMLDFSSRAEVTLHFEVTPKVIAVALLGSLAMGVIGGLLPALRAARTSVLVALRG
jgi:putative ABC transport system permease protein